MMKLNKTALVIVIVAHREIADTISYIIYDVSAHLRMGC